MPDLLTAALGHAARGWHVFPIVTGTKRPANRHGVTDATTDTMRINEWWTANPDSGIGIDAAFAGSTGRGAAYVQDGAALPGNVTVQQYFTSEPNMGAAAASASWSFYPIMAAAPAATA